MKAWIKTFLAVLVSITAAGCVTTVDNSSLLNTWATCARDIAIMATSIGTLIVVFHGMIFRSFVRFVRRDTPAGRKLIGFAFFWRLVEESTAWERYRNNAEISLGGWTTGWKVSRSLRVYGIFFEGGEGGDNVILGRRVYPATGLMSEYPAHRRYAWTGHDGLLHISRYYKEGVEQLKMVRGQIEDMNTLTEDDFIDMITEARNRMADKDRQQYAPMAHAVLREGTNYGGTREWFRSNRTDLLNALDKKIEEAERSL